MLLVENIDIWEKHKQGNVVCVTTNGTVTAKGQCVMGGGTALQAQQLFPDLPYELGSKISKHGNHVYYFSKYKLITFPTKRVVQEYANLDLIAASCKRLMLLINKQLFAGDVYLPKPGSALGGLRWEDVRPVIEPLLDDRVIIVDYKGYDPFTGIV